MFFNQSPAQTTDTTPAPLSRARVRAVFYPAGSQYAAGRSEGVVAPNGPPIRAVAVFDPCWLMIKWETSI
jgi:hypothetical protein